MTRVDSGDGCKPDEAPGQNPPKMMQGHFEAPKRASVSVQKVRTTGSGNLLRLYADQAAPPHYPNPMCWHRLVSDVMRQTQGNFQGANDFFTRMRRVSTPTADAGRTPVSILRPRGYWPVGSTGEGAHRAAFTARRGHIAVRLSGTSRRRVKPTFRHLWLKGSRAPS
ncbi:hypothetical protein VUR80DRAFT_7877 [Thermomyces stellatus]